MKSKRYIVFPHGMVTREELAEAIELLNLSLKEPEVAIHNGSWNVEAKREEAEKEKEKW